MRSAGKTDIPYSIVRKLEIILGVEYGHLTNQDIIAEHYSKIIERIPASTIRRVRKGRISV